MLSESVEPLHSQCSYVTFALLCRCILDELLQVHCSGNLALLSQLLFRQLNAFNVELRQRETFGLH